MVHIVPESGFARAYLICEGKNILAVDVGSIGAAHEIEAYCADVLRSSTRAIRFIVATHFHTDHIGGIGELLRICGPEAQVLFHPLVRPDGHLKIPHPWPGQNPPPQGGQNGVLFSCFSFLTQVF